jgi:thioester reductase-like protein
MKILMTGATGFIGKRLLDRLNVPGNEIYILVRPQSLQKARDLFASKENIHFILGDVSNNDVLENVTGVETLPEDIECVIHLAAIYDLEVGLSEAYANNVVGTQNVIYLCQRMKHLKYYHHISTYAVSGLYDGDFHEEQIEANGKFPDFYARTKMQAEYLVRNALMKNVKVRIYRPGIVIGDSTTGEMDKVDGPYYFFRFFHLLEKLNHNIPVKVLPLSCHRSSTLPLLPVNTLVDWLGEMITRPTKDKLRSYHLVPVEKIFITDFVEESLPHFNLAFKVKRIPFPELYASVLPLLNIPKQLVPYMQSRTRYQNQQLKKDFPHLTAPSFRDYLPKIVKGAREMFV